MKIVRIGIALTCVLGMTAVYACGGGGGGGVRSTGGSICGIECSGTADCSTPVGQQSGSLSIVGASCVMSMPDATATLSCDGTGSATTSDGTVSGTWTGSGTTVSGDFEGAWTCSITPATTPEPDAGTSDTGTSDTGTVTGTTCGLECSGTAVCTTPIGQQSGPVTSAEGACIFAGQDGIATLFCDGTGSATSAEGTVAGTWSGSGTSVTGDFDGTWSCVITPGSMTSPDAGTGDTLCADTCIFAGDTECDDGGPGYITDFCDYGTDCTDCGPRSPEM